MPGKQVIGVHQYVRDTEYAATTLINAVTHEALELEKTNQELAMAQAAHDSAEQMRDAKQMEASFKFELHRGWDLNDDVDPARAVSMFNQAARAHQDAEGQDRELVALARELAAKQAEVDALTRSILNHTASVEALAGALLQLAHQGIALVHGATTWQATCPRGRQIGSVDLRDLVWQGRNQAAHWDDPPARQFHPPVFTVFAALAAEQGPQFDLAGANRNRAVDIVRLLGWNMLAAWQTDMAQLLP